MTDGCVDNNAGGDGSAARFDERDDQRHAQRPLVREHPVRQLAVFAEALAMIRRHDDQRRTRQRRQRVEQRPEGPIDCRDLAVIGLTRIPRGK